MKKLAALFVSFLLLAAFSVPVFAAEPDTAELTAAKFVNNSRWRETSYKSIDAKYNKNQSFIAVYYNKRDSVSINRKTVFNQWMNQYKVNIYGIDINSGQGSLWMWEALNWKPARTPVVCFVTSQSTKWVYTGAASVTTLNSAMKAFASSKPVSGVKLNRKSLKLAPGQSAQLEVTVSPVLARNKKVVWSVADESVATVKQNGRVTGVAPGTTTVTVKSRENGKFATCSVTVSQAVQRVKSVKLNRGSATLKKGKTLQLRATVSPSAAANKAVSWSSSKPKVARVSATGKVTALKAGKATIIVRTADGGKTARCRITVKNK